LEGHPAPRSSFYNPKFLYALLAAAPASTSRRSASALAAALASLASRSSRSFSAFALLLASHSFLIKRRTLKGVRAFTAWAPDSNTAENAIRPLALGRKNWLFAASERGARATALFLGLLHSCKACGVNPWEYFDDMLRPIMSHPVNRLRELLPDRWQPLSKDERGLIIRF
jgi:transposase